MAYHGYELPTMEPFTTDQFVGDGNITKFTLSLPKPVTARGILVTLAGLVQVPFDEYYLDTDGDLIFQTAPGNAVTINVLHLSQPKPVQDIPDNSIGSSKLIGNLVTPADLTVTNNLQVVGSVVLGQAPAGPMEAATKQYVNRRSSLLSLIL